MRFSLLPPRHCLYVALYRADLLLCKTIKEVHSTVRIYDVLMAPEAHWHYGREAAVRVLMSADTASAA